MLVLKIALRNLWRQKRRNILLGIAIAVCMSILVATYSFSHGISDILLNKIVVNLTGHISINVIERGDKNYGIIRDKTWLENAIKNQLQGDYAVREGVSTSFTRVIGNGKSGNMVIMGMPTDGGELARETVLDGSIDDFVNGTVKYPVLIYRKTADELNLKVGDIMRAKFETIYGQSQSARFQVVAIIGGDNIFSSFVAFTTIDTAKELMNYKEQETGNLSIVFNDLDNPARVIMMADALHKSLIPPVEGLPVKGQGAVDVTMYGYSTYVNKIRPLFDALMPGTLVPEQEGEEAGDPAGLLDPGDLGEDLEAIFLSQSAAGALGVKNGDQVTLTYNGEESTFNVLGIFKDQIGVDGKDWSLKGPNPVLVMEDTYHLWRLHHPPETVVALDKAHPSSNLLAGKYKLLDRVRTSDEYSEKFREISNKKMKGIIVDVGTMYEMASQVIEMEAVFKMIIGVVMLVLFAVIFVGIINTLRMSIRERTREIGTIRAIGMQRKMVQRTFVAEVVVLTIVACFAGILLGFILIQLFGAITIDFGADNPLSILLINNHLHFVPKAGSIFTSFFLLVLVSFIFAHISSRRAAKLKVADALRHFE